MFIKQTRQYSCWFSWFEVEQHNFLSQLMWTSWCANTMHLFHPIVDVSKSINSIFNQLSLDNNHNHGHIFSFLPQHIYTIKPLPSYYKNRINIRWSIKCLQILILGELMFLSCTPKMWMHWLDLHCHRSRT